MTAGLASATLGLTASPAQAITFGGYYAPNNWTQTIQGDGSIDTSGAPASITLTNANDGGGNQNTDFTIAASTAGTVSFDWNFTNNNSYNSFWDPFGYLLNGAFNQLTTDSLFSQSGSIAFSVNTGDVFGFRQNSVDSADGTTSTTITNFSAPTSVPGPLPILGVGAAFAYARRLRRRINLAKGPVGTDSVVAEQQ